MAKKMKKMCRATGGPTPPPSFKQGKTVRQKKGVGGKIMRIGETVAPIIGAFLAEGGVCREQPQRRYMPHNRGYQVSAQAASHGVPVLQRKSHRPS